MTGPNPDQNLGQLLGITETYLELVGSAFWYLARNPLTNEVRELWALPSQNIRIKTDDDGYVECYQYQPLAGGEKVEYDPKNIIHFRFMNPADPNPSSFGVPPLRAVWQRVQLLRQEQSSHGRPC